MIACCHPRSPAINSHHLQSLIAEAVLSAYVCVKDTENTGIRMCLNELKIVKR